MALNGQERVWNGRETVLNGQEIIWNGPVTIGKRPEMVRKLHGMVEMVSKGPEMVWNCKETAWNGRNGNGQKMGKMAPRPSWMVKNGKKKGLGWPGNGLKLLEIDSEWSQVGQLNGQELGKDGEDKR